ncbi:hypothetical protein MTR67_025659, partial [Solanum verrucosum]
WRRRKEHPAKFLGVLIFVTEILLIRGYFESEWWWSSSRSSSISSRYPEPGNSFLSLSIISLILVHVVVFCVRADLKVVMFLEKLTACL